jgi:hypothetical protein
MKYLFSLFLVFNFSYADLDDFDTRQTVIKKIKQMIQKEESIVRAYESYIQTNYSLPSSVDDLINDTYLGASFSKNVDATYFNNLSTSSIYSIKDNLKDDSYLKSLYESNTFRKMTYYRNSVINFLFEDDFTKHIYSLIKSQSGPIVDCTTIGTKYCKEDSHIKIYDTTTRTNLLMNYHIDKFITGPIIISNNTSLHITSDEFNSIPSGALLYDTDGIKYIKTSTSIEELK